MCVPRIHCQRSSHDPRTADEFTDNDQALSTPCKCIWHQIRGSFSCKSKLHGVSIEAISVQHKLYFYVSERKCLLQLQKYNLGAVIRRISEAPKKASLCARRISLSVLSSKYIMSLPPLRVRYFSFSRLTVTLTSCCVWI